MKKISVLFVFMVMVFSASFAQTNPQNSKKERPSFSELLQKMDTNNDGRLAQSEVKGRLSKHFDTVDTNKDGFITQAELEHAAKLMKGRKGERPSTAQIFEKLDTNIDGRLAKSEVSGRMAEHFDKVDVNQDGFISTEEMENAPKRKGKRGKFTPAQILEKLDSNNDGRLAKSEVSGRMAEHFDKVDLNQDGFITTEEMENAPKRKGKRGKFTPAQILEKMDSNNDGRLAKSEVGERMAKHFDKIDTNQDGFLSVQELENRPKRRKGSRGR